ncbi:M15 family metallopeptidase [Myxococcus landrumensis]|uniref:M15 family metallopeptidase n=1 Tax=Myxococcus landrumensis TaxID=2813577 RepID=A0ABX7MYV6_9BACT|nr:M15 family metallopeptidase [Myxococcus landrumus]QSQ10660.1 M15 family metallopeptidase [Myxococcus landrumus]
MTSLRFLVRASALCLVFLRAPVLAAEPVSPSASVPSARQRTPEPPSAWACLAKWYPVLTPVSLESGWGFALPDGRVFLFDDGEDKPFARKLDAPDLEDTLSIPYRTGPITPVTREDDDPGRIRFEPLFEAMYGASREKVDVVSWVFFGQKLKVHRKVLPAFQRVAARLEPLVEKDASLRAFLRGAGGTFAWRNIANTNRRSAHSYGVSLDLNTARSHYWEWQRPKSPVRWRNAVPQALVDAFEAEGFIWGGRWYHYDTMHFEYRPELLDAACAPAR